MKSILLCCLLVLGAVCADDTWESYKSNHGKSYSAAEEGKRKALYAKTHAAIQAHNKRHASGMESFSMAHSKFSDMLPEEKAAHLGFRPKPSARDARSANFDLTVEDRALPTSYDLRTSKCMPAIKNQGNCGDCWTFATVMPIEYQYCLKKNNNVSVTLSEQQVTDCTYTSDGCQGGDHHDAWAMIYSRGGLASSSAYPFVSGTSGVANACAFSSTKVVAKLANGVGTDIPQMNEPAMQAALVTYGPLTFAYYVSDNFYYYSTGVFSDSTCLTDYNSLNHEMTIVGYGVSGTTPYWIVRNQWGTGWGMSGYAYIKRGTNECGISMEAGYPSVV